MRTLKPVILAVLLTALWPAGAQTNSAPLPAVDAVLKRVAERALKEEENDQAFKAHYAYQRTQKTEYSNSKGEIKKQEEKTTVKNPLLKAASFPPGQNPKAKEDPDDGSETGELSESRSRVHGKQLDRKDVLFTDEMFSRFEFTIASREQVNGRPTLAIDFKPANRKVPEKSLKDRFINKAAGRIWVDEAEAVPVKAKIFLSEKVNVGGGLVGAVKRFDYSFDRARTEDGLWYTREVNWHLEGREVIINRTVDYHEERTDVRKVK